jgi:hypothetical protein
MQHHLDAGSGGKKKGGASGEVAQDMKKPGAICKEIWKNREATHRSQRDRKALRLRN